MKHAWMLATVMLSALTVSAQTGPDADHPNGQQGKQETRHDDLDRLARKHGMTRDDLERMHKEGMSWSDIGSAAWISEHGKRPMSEVTEQHRAGSSWDDIAKKHDLDASQMHHGSREFRHEALQAERGARREGRHEAGHGEGRHEQGHDEMQGGHDRGDQDHGRDGMDQDHDRGAMDQSRDRDMRQDQSHGEGPHQ